MPTNRIKIEVEQGVGLKCELWDGQGTCYDISDIFQQLSDFTTGGRQNTDLSLRHTQDTLSTNVRFQATKKELLYDVPPAVIDQILQMKG